MTILSIPGAVVIGNSEACNADLSDIDLTSAKLDSRVKYQCASHHAYYAANNTIQYADPDVWPLEYRDGEAIGRHAPEPQSANLLPHASDFLTGWTAVNTGVSESTDTLFADIPAQCITASVSATYTRVYQIPALMTGNCVFSLYVRPGTTSYLHVTIEDEKRKNSSHFYADLKTQTGGIISASGKISVNVSVKKMNNDWLAVTATMVLPASSLYYIYFGAANAAKTVSATAGNSIVVAFVQVENTQMLTSPILTDSITAARAEATASVRIYPGLTGLRISYSDGITDTVLMNGNEGDWYQLPNSKLPWSTRYIQRIGYFKE